MLKFKLSEVSFTFSKLHLRVMKRLTNVCHLTEEQLSWNLFCNDSLIAFWISYPFPSLFISPLFFPHFLEKSYHPFCNKIPTFVCICYRSVCVCVCVCVCVTSSVPTALPPTQQLLSLSASVQRVPPASGRGICCPAAGICCPFSVLRENNKTEGKSAPSVIVQNHYL